ncbi:hypothetical protein H4R33_001017 [Dimargaris cristalligena]|uniref:Post-GPI attachment to proteins factor 3 n=1 Tax=Dimargaris cristalligena TaxID=215637 RepID=A0A4Q0A417_9FUNG|nr:hypothetical protein H4R33_001017 [Dimargaris cristalligena]RKP40000.1 Mn2+ homeostasis protein [Dimargaris cristalligena]|eukprot:RKP40000.1 Mn2+ homeostasis protein [Dimargaris cristalligena]
MRLPTLPSYRSALLTLGALMIVAPLVGGSSGDRSPQFRVCVTTCENLVCQDPEQSQLPLSLRLFFWTCPQNCCYECMQTITEAARENHLPIHQYYGKWPFYRLAGIQEPASVLFSILNGYAHYRHWDRVRSEVKSDYFMKPWYLAYIAVNVNTWVWSTVFHTRDFGWTEKMDYFSAGFSVLFMLLVALIRAFHLRPGRSSALKPLVMMHLAAFVAHVAYLSLWKFDYSYNMTANIIVGLISNSVWISWSFSNRLIHPLAWRPTICVLLISAATSLELFDFPPLWGIFDAHSLWHAATIPITYMFYDFIIRDTQWDYKYMRIKA